MKDDNLSATPIELGSASEATLGGKGQSTDLVREIPATAGISDD